MFKGKIKLAILIDEPMINKMFKEEDFAFIKTFADIVNENAYENKMTADYAKKWLKDADACFTCWGSQMFTKDILDCAPKLKIILHGAGTPKAVVTDEVWERGIRVASCAPVIAIDVAETTIGAMIFSLKHMADYNNIIQKKEWGSKKGSIDQPNNVDLLKNKIKRLNWMLTVGIVSCSHVAKNLIRFLKPFGVNILLYDPYMTQNDAREHGFTLCGLDELMAKSDVVTLHAPKLDETNNLITKERLAMMQDGSLLINTSRGTVVDQVALTEELKSGRISAYLDVFESEPLSADSELIGLDNVILTPHISGGHTLNGSRERGKYLIEQLHSYCTLGSLKNETIEDMLDRMA